MGLLDDAIREHLELKRRHGADPEEVSRQEREALGAPVRGEFAQPAAGEPESEVDEQLSGEEPDEAPPPAEEEQALAPPQPGDEEDPRLVEDIADEPPPAAYAASRDEPPPGEEPAEDVLEETPEFLQETPEHERLWFEQKPPRDFDWDK
jgi:hypothetical protein